MRSNQKPRIRVVPEIHSSLGDVAFDLMNSYGMMLDKWQRNVIDDWLAIDENAKYVCSPCGLSVPRQNGKTALVKCRVIFGMVAFDEQILYTAHEVKTARKTFDELALMFELNGKYPELAAQVDFIRRANGQEEIKLRDYQDEDGIWHNGGRVVFSARSRGASRGFTCDCLIADEAQELTAEQMAALMPVISAGANQNPQVIMIGTPPSPSLACEIFATVRKAALSDDSGKTCWHEWSVDEVGDVKDWKRVEATNPAIDVRLMRNAVEAEMNTMPPDYFARERLGWWSDRHNRDTVIPESEWNGCKAEPPNDGLIVYAVKFAIDGSVGSIAVCMKPTDGLPYIELIETRALNGGITWFVEWIAQRHTKAAQIVIDGGGNAQTLNERLLQSGVKQREIIRPKSSDIASACASLVSAVHEQRIAHMGQEQLDASATQTERRRIGTNGGYGFASTEDADATAIEACALAYWQAQITRRNPTRQIEVW